MKQRATVVVLGLAAVVLAGGCSSNSSQVGSSAQLTREVRSVPAPKLRTLSQRREDVRNETVLTLDTNARARWQEFRRFWLLDRPSLLTREPMPH